MFRPGDTLNHGAYRIERQLGAGGFGVVYLAEEITLQRKVAIKTILPDVAAREPRAAEVFYAEARVTAGLSHPYILPIYFIGEERSGDQSLPYIVMEYVDGGDLETILARKSVDLRQRVRWMQQIAEGLAYAHEQGVLHRDLKPRNVFVTRHQAAKIGDFGLAKVLGAETQTVLRGLGTPAYIAPEQIQGRPADARADLYALGVMYYQVLTGCLPYDAPEVTDLSARIMSIGYQHVHAPIPSAQALNPEVSPELDRLVQRLMAKAPEARPASASEVAQALDSLLMSGPRAPRVSSQATIGSPQAAGEPSKQPIGLTLAAAGSTQAVVGSTQGSGGTTRTAIAPTQMAVIPARKLSPKWLAIPVAVLVLGVGAFLLWPKKGVEVVTPPRPPLDQPIPPTQGPARATDAPQLDSARLKAEEEGQRALAQEEAARKRVEEARVARLQEAQRQQEEARRLQEAQRTAAREEAARKQKEEEAARQKGEAEAARKRAEEERLAKLREEQRQQEEAKRGEEERQARSRAELLTWTENALRSAGFKSLTVAVSPERIVTLTGTVQDQRQRDEAVRLANLGPGVREVRPSITVVPPPPDPEEIRRQVVQRLKENGLTLTVEVTPDRIVMLAGVVESGEQRDRAKNIAAGITGVREVRDGIFIAPPSSGPRRVR